MFQLTVVRGDLVTRGLQRFTACEDLKFAFERILCGMGHTCAGEEAFQRIEDHTRDSKTGFVSATSVWAKPSKRHLLQHTYRYVEVDSKDVADDDHRANDVLPQTSLKPNFASASTNVKDLPGV